jgi:monovalent cation/hydrogen antiporter
MFGDLIASYQRRLDAMPAEREEQVKGLIDQTRRNEAILAALQVEREAPILLRNEGRIDDEVSRTAEKSPF